MSFSFTPALRNSPVRRLTSKVANLTNLGEATASGTSECLKCRQSSTLSRSNKQAVGKHAFHFRVILEAQHVSGQVPWSFEWDFSAAETAFRKAVELDPSNAWAHTMLSHAVSQMGRHKEARAVMERAFFLEPLSPLHQAMWSQLSFQARDHEHAAERARRAIVLDPGYMMLGQASEQLGEMDIALDARTTATRLSAGNSKPVGLRGTSLRTSELRADASRSYAGNNFGDAAGSAKSRFCSPLQEASLQTQSSTPTSSRASQRVSSQRRIRLFLDSNVLTGGIVSPWGLDKAVLSLCAARLCRLVLAEIVRDEVEENLLLHAERLPALDADELIEHYRRLVKLTDPEIVPYPEKTLLQSNRHLIRHSADVPVLLSAMSSKPDWLLTHNTKHFTQAVANRTGLRIATPVEFFRTLSSLLR